MSLNFFVSLWDVLNCGSGFNPDAGSALEGLVPVDELGGSSDVDMVRPV